VTSESSSDVVVIGAGMIGAMCALRLIEEGVRVTLVEQHFPGGGSTGAAMGHVVAMDDTPAQLALCAYSLGRWEALRHTFDGVAEYDVAGTLWLASDDAELNVATRRATSYRAAGVKAQVVDTDSLELLEPNLAFGLAGALKVEGDGVCYPPAIVRELVTRAVASGLRIVTGRVATLDTQCACLEDGSRIRAAHIVVAAGVNSIALVPRLPLVPRKGHLVITDRQPGLIRHQLVELGYLRSAHTMANESVAFNVQPRRNGQLLIGSSRELVGQDNSINRSMVRAMLERAVRFVPRIASARAWRSWTGFRPTTPDALPLIGAWQEMPGVWIATGHEGLGITMAPGTADIIVAGILGVAPPVDATPFLPDRPIRIRQVA